MCNEGQHAYLKEMRELLADTVSTCPEIFLSGRDYFVSKNGNFVSDYEILKNYEKMRSVLSRVESYSKTLG